MTSERVGEPLAASAVTPLPTRPPADAGEAALVARAEALAERLLVEALSGRGWRERLQGQRIARLLADPDGLAFVIALTDEVLRIRDPERAARHFRGLVATGGRPRFLGPVDRTLLRAGAGAAARLPKLVMPLLLARVRAELAPFLVAAEPGAFARHVRRRRAQGVRLNVNLLGEEVLGDDEAERRCQAVLALLRRSDVEYVSVKVSSICAQLNIVAFEDEVRRLAAQLRRRYHEALVHRPPKLVKLDMEEYRDLDLTVAVFKRVLDEDRYTALDAGIVLQAYVPDSLRVLCELLPWARARRARGGQTTPGQGREPGHRAGRSRGGRAAAGPVHYEG